MDRSVALKTASTNNFQMLQTLLRILYKERSGTKIVCFLQMIRIIIITFKGRSNS